MSVKRHLDGNITHILTLDILGRIHIDSISKAQGFGISEQYIVIL